MPKGERRRRRREEQETATASSEAEQSPGAEQMDQQNEDPVSPFAEPAAPAPEEAGTEVEPEQGGAPRRVALAEVLSKPVFPNVTPERVIPPRAAGDVIGSESPPPSFADDEESHQPQTSETEVYEVPPDSAFEPAASAPDLDPPPRHSREPVILALLLAVLVVLLVNAYFTMRLNGLSDRLSAAVSNTAAAPVSAGERPWVGVDKVSTVPFANGGQPVTTVHIVNSGHEPAYDLRSNTAGSLRSAATPAPAVPAQPGQLAVTALLMPNVGGNLTFFGNTRALTPEEAANVKSGQYVLWLAGRLDYKDSHGHPHLTTFRYRYNPALNTFVATPQGNNAN